MIIVRILVGVGTIFFGLMVYPYYVDYILTPVIETAESLITDLTAWESMFLGFAPFYAFFIIIFFGVMYIIGKVPLFTSQKDELMDDSGDD